MFHLEAYSYPIAVASYRHLHRELPVLGAALMHLPIGMTRPPEQASWLPLRTTDRW